MDTVGAYEVDIYIGSRNEKTHQPFDKQELINVVGRFQTASGSGTFLPVRISDVTYVSGVDYYETGFQITACRLPARTDTEKDVWAWANRLAKHLLVTFDQHRVGVSDPDHMIYHRAENGDVKSCG